MSNDEEYNYQKYNIFNFSFSQLIVDENLIYELRNQPMQKIYVISREDFNNGFKFLKEKNEFYYFFNSENELDINFYTKANQINKKEKNLELILVNEKFLKLLEIDEKEYEDKSIFYIILNKKNYLYFPNDKNSIYELFNDNIIEKNKDSLKENILKKLILLYANERHFLELLRKPIKDEYDTNEYYLINKNWIEEYKNKFNFNEIKKELDNMNLDELSYKGFCYNLENLAQSEKLSKIKINLLNDKNEFYNENNLQFLTYKQDFNNIPQIQNNICPKEFILLQENLFDLFYEDIIKDKLSFKNDYKFNILLGDNILFIQDNNDKLIYYLFTLDKTYELNYIFKFENSNIFYNEVKLFIKGKGLYNYIVERKIEYKKKMSIKDLFNEKDNIIGKYILFKKIGKDIVDKAKMKIIINQNMDLYKRYKKFNEQLLFINDNQMDLDDINDIYAKYKNNNLNFVKVGVVLEEDLIKLENDLYFNEIEEIIQIKDDKKSEEKFNEIVNKFKKVENCGIFKLISLLKLYDYNDIDIDNNKNIKYNLIDIEELNSIKEINFSSEVIYFKNKDEFYIFYPNAKKLYLLENYKGKGSFTLKQCNFDSFYVNILMHLKGIYQNEEKIKNLIKKPLGNITQPKKYYLVNNDWFKNYKKIYKYDYYLNVLENSDEKLICNLKIQNIPKEFKDNHTLEANTTKILNKYDAPIDFELIDKNIFDKILKDINDKNNPQIQSDMIYPISFGGDKIFIDINNIYFIFSSKQQNYKLEYIFELKNDNIKNFCSNCENNENFEKFMAKYDIDFSSKNEQNIINDNLDIIGNFVNIEQKNWVKIDKPNHCLGLENIGATCYMNATIQCLCNVFNLKKKFQDKNLMYKYINKGDCPLTKEFYKLVNNLWKYPKKKNYYTPTDFKNCISKMNPLFKGIAANDSKDLIIFIYETIHAEINKQKKYNKDISDNQELALFRNDYYSKNCSFLIDIFYFEQQSELTCLNCNYTKISYNIANIIIFPLEKVREYMIKKSPHGFISVTLDNCFENYQEVELLNGENQIYCNNCYRMSNATTGNKIFTSPEVMTIILNRGKGLEFEVNFEYPLEIDINKYIIDKSSTGNFKYTLICVLCHYGPSGMAGHFIAFCLSPEDGNWYCYNDSQVSQCKDPRYENNGSIEGIPYVLFYQKSEVNKKQNSIINNIININNDIEDKKNPSSIDLIFNYEEKQFNLSVSKSMKIKNVIKKLKKEYDIIPNNIGLYFFNNGNFDKLDESNFIKDYDIKNNSELTILTLN